MLRLLLLFFTKAQRSIKKEAVEVVKISVWCDDGKATIDFNCSNGRVV